MNIGIYFDCLTKKKIPQCITGEFLTILNRGKSSVLMVINILNSSDKAKHFAMNSTKTPTR